ncbi:hypothetical protein EUGRSUZ_J02724 [Eucalyptus grandis]|uniref:Uncharacterized protein n=2 Tax=Eucalyptus grandis TaxID=71139 RepID=A0ACC3JAM2_EUCGR|nr:hypothetical protein EUGRSUZ_J02724 [Eucalyptus grandis]
MSSLTAILLDRVLEGKIEGTISSSFWLVLTCTSLVLFGREKELAAVKINAADVDIIANKLELDRKVAERTLREHKGDAVAAIRSLLQ